jgi:hypothetical protein
MTEAPRPALPIVDPDPILNRRCHAKKNPAFSYRIPSQTIAFGSAGYRVSVRGHPADEEIRLPYSPVAPDSRCPVPTGSEGSGYYDNSVYGLIGPSSARRNRPKRTCRACRDGSYQRLGRRAPPSGTRVCLGACQSLARSKTPGYANPERRRVSESGRFVRVASAGTHGLRPGRAGSKGLWGAVTASGGGAERAGPLAASPEIAVPHCPHFQPARSRSWRGR